MDVHVVCKVYKRRGKQWEWGDGQGCRAEETNSDNTFLWQIYQADLTVGDRAHLALADFYCSGNVTYALLYIPLYFKHILPPQSAEHTAATLTFIDARRIHNVTGVWVGSRSSLLETDDIRMQTVARLTEACFLNKGLINMFTEVLSWIYSY